MAQKGSFVEVAFIGPGEKRALGLGIGCFVTLLDEEVLLVNDGVVREDFSALTQVACSASYSSAVRVKSSGSVTRKAAVTSANFERMQFPSTASSGNFDSRVEVFRVPRMASAFG